MAEVLARVAGAPRRLRRQARTVRGRSTMLSMGVVATALIVALATVVVLYSRQLEANLDQTLEQQVIDRARLLDQGSSPESLTTVLEEEALVWIGTVEGEPIAIGGTVFPLENPVPDRLGGVVEMELLVEERNPGEVEVERMELRVASATTVDGLVVVLAGAETEVVTETIRPLVTLFAIALPILTVLVGLVTWLVSGRVLRPVVEMSRQASEITGTTLGARVPVPETDDEVHDLAETLNSMLDRIEVHDRALREFTADASHELKSPVANLRALVDTSAIDDPAWPDLRGRLTGESDRLRDLVENLLFLASHHDGGAPRAATTVHLDDLLFDEAELLAATGRVSVDLTGVEPAEVRGSKADIARLVRNLVDNAARHADGRVRLSSATDNGHAVLAVEDDGPGIPVADRERIFERFTRLDAARARDDGGSGLGLAIVDRIASDHEATVTISDGDAGGARFEVRFPS